MKKFAVLYAIGLMVLGALTVFADGGATASVKVGQQEIHVGDVVPITVTVNHPKGWRVVFPPLDKKWGELEVRSQGAAQIAENADGSETTTQEIDVAYFRPEQVTTPEMTLEIANAQGQVEAVKVEPTMLNVTSVLQQDDMELRDIKPQAELWQLSSSPIPFVASIALALTLVGGLGYMAWKNRPVPDRRTPRERALDEIKAIEATPHLISNDAKTYCVRVSESLRDYLAAGCGIPAHDLTTGELAQQLKQKEVPPQVAAQIIHVLRVSDTAKFANDVSDVEAIKTLSGITMQIVMLYPPAPQAKGNAAHDVGSKVTMKSIPVGSRPDSQRAWEENRNFEAASEVKK